MNDIERNELAGKLVREGLKSYLDVLTALNAFRETVSSAASKLLNEKLPHLAAASSIPIQPTSSVQPYFNPNGFAKTQRADWAWVAASVVIGEPLRSICYFGLSYDRRDDRSQSQAYATFIYGNISRALYNILGPVSV